MNTLLSNNQAQKKSKVKSIRDGRRNKNVLVTKTETFRSSEDARTRAQQLRDINIETVFILQKQIEIFYVRYRIAK